jgi:PIN domain nuclease of toxin-antitoxin system
VTSIVLDACAIIAYLRDESGAAEVVDVLLNPEYRCFAHSINLCEVFYDFHRASGVEDARRALQDIARAGIVESSLMTADLWETAGIIKSIHRRVSLADCFAVALSQKLGGILLTSDHAEFDPLVRQQICRVRFIR